MSVPLVSVIMPCHNAEAWVAEAIDSALAQTHPHIEVIVVDDASTDNSSGVLEKYAGRITLLRHETNKGAAAARNTALQHARGDYLQYLDADDVLAPAKVERQIAMLRKPGNARRVASCRWGRFFDRKENARFVPEPVWRDAGAQEWLRDAWQGGGMMVPAAWLVSAEVARAAGEWDPALSLNDDGEYFCRVLLASDGVLFVPDAEVYYRSGQPGRLSGLRSRRGWESALRVCHLCRAHLLEAEDSPVNRRACATLFQRFACDCWPEEPDLVAEAERCADELGGSDYRPGGGRAFQLLSTALGWKTARRVQHAWRRRTAG